MAWESPQHEEGREPLAELKAKKLLFPNLMSSYCFASTAMSWEDIVLRPCFPRGRCILTSSLWLKSNITALKSICCSSSAPRQGWRSSSVLALFPESTLAMQLWSLVSTTEENFSVSSSRLSTQSACSTNGIKNISFVFWDAWDLPCLPESLCWLSMESPFH